MNRRFRYSVRNESNVSLKTNRRLRQTGNPAPEFTGGIATLQMKAVCPCDGGCPTCSSNIQLKQIPDKPHGLNTDVHNRIQSLKGGGKPLPASTRAFFEPRFGRNFSDVRIHTGLAASDTAKTINAEAFTMGKDVVFGQGRYSPHTGNGKNLLAHELTHVIQQDKTGTNPLPIQRKIVVNPGVTEAQEISSQLTTLCPGATLNRSGQTITGTYTGTANNSCKCVKEAVKSTGRTFTINVTQIKSSWALKKLHSSWIIPSLIPIPTIGPHTTPGKNPTIVLPSSTGSTVEFGAFDSSGNAKWVPDLRLLAHELCGHGVLSQTYSGTKGNRPGHDSTIKTENDIAAEHKGFTRGKFSDPKQGESFHNPVGDRSKIVFKLVNGWHYEAP